MKTFLLFFAIWITSLLISFNIWKDSKSDEMLKAILGTQVAWIIYNLLKEEYKD